MEEADLTVEDEQMSEQDEQMSEEEPKVWRQTSNMFNYCQAPVPAKLG